MITITNESGFACQYSNLDQAVEAARDYLLSRMSECDLTGRVVITCGGKFVAALTWENVW